MLNIHLGTKYLFNVFSKGFPQAPHSKQGLESITQIALIAITVIASARCLYAIVNQEFVSKLREDQPKPTPSPKIVEVLRANGIRLERDSEENSHLFICSNKSFTDINRATQNLPEEEKRELGCFFYSPEKRSICCDLSSDYRVACPKSSQIPFLLKASRTQLEEDLPPLPLSNGSYCSEKAFTQNPLFQNTLERHTVFRELCRLRSERNFEENYQSFLDHIHSNNTRWAEVYRNDPTNLAYLSLYAYLNGDITKEELFIVHMLSSAFLESPDSANYFVLSQENVRANLQDYYYLSEGNVSQDFYCLRNLHKKSLIERTAVFYESKQDGDVAAYSTTVGRGGARIPGVKLFKDDQKNHVVRICFFPPWLCKRLYSELYPNQSPPVEHEEFFGYRARLDDLVLGRPISYASPLFYLPPAHNIEGTQLSVTAHDLLYHCLLDWQHPHAENLIKLGQKIRSMGRESLELAVNMLDRPLVKISSDPDTSISDHLKMYDFVIKKLPEEKQAKFFLYCKEIFGESVIDKIFSTDHFDQKFRP